jgi:hypothetical protein
VLAPYLTSEVFRHVADHVNLLWLDNCTLHSQPWPCMLVAPLTPPDTCNCLTSKSTLNAVAETLNFAVSSHSLSQQVVGCFKFL